MINTLEKIQKIFRDVFDNEEMILDRHTKASDVQGWDSLAHITLVVAIEKDFGIKFSIDELQQMTNIGNMIDMIEGKLHV
jgi:acyl carrier protein